MKKIAVLSMAVVLGAGLVAPAASAQSYEDLFKEIRCGSNAITGPDSELACDIEQEIIVVCKNNNEVTVRNTTNQTAVSGDTEVTYNTSAGDSSTGDAENSNTTTLGAVIENECAVSEDDKDKGGQGGGHVDKDKDKKVDQDQPVGGMGAGVPPQGGAGAAPSSGFGAGVASLPETSGVSSLTYVSFLAIAAGVVTLAARFAVAAYGRFNA